MNRSSKAITLALIGSALFLNGCGETEPEVEEEENGTANAATPHRGGGGVFIVPRLGGRMGGGGGGGGMSSAPSARGGFGSTGSASVGS